MTINPWCQLPASPPYVLPDDKPFVQNFNDKPNRNPDHILRVDAILPEPFVGMPNAPIVLLSNNPGFREIGLPLKQSPDFIQRMRNNLLHEPMEYPFIYLAPDFQGPGKEWWESKLKELLLRFGPKVISKSILNVSYLPYASCRYQHSALRLPSQSYSFHLVDEARKRGAIIIRMRKRSPWLDKVKGLEAYCQLFDVQNSQNPAISNRNCHEFEKVMQAIEAATKNK